MPEIGIQSWNQIVVWKWQFKPSFEPPRVYSYLSLEEKLKLLCCLGDKKWC